MGEGLLVGAWVALKQRNGRAGVQNEQWLCRWNSSHWTSPSLDSSSSGRLVSIWGGTAHKWQGEMARHSGEWPPPPFFCEGKSSDNTPDCDGFMKMMVVLLRGQRTVLCNTSTLGLLFVDTLGEHHVCRDTMPTSEVAVFIKVSVWDSKSGLLARKHFESYFQGLIISWVINSNCKRYHDEKIPWFM